MTDLWDAAVSAQGLLDAARILAQRYHLVITNVPYLSRGKQHDALRGYCEENYSRGRYDLACVFIERCYELANELGTVCVVSSQNWWFLGIYESFRRWLLLETRIGLIAAHGEDAWQHFGDRGPLATLMLGTKTSPSRGPIYGLNAICRARPESGSNLTV